LLGSAARHPAQVLTRRDVLGWAKVANPTDSRYPARIYSVRLP